MTELAELLKRLTRPPGGREVDVPSTRLSTRGTPESNGASGRRQPELWREANERGDVARVAVGDGLAYVSYRADSFAETSVPVIVVCHPSELAAGGAWAVIERSERRMDEVALDEGEADLIRAVGDDGAYRPRIPNLTRAKREADRREAPEAPKPEPAPERAPAPVVVLRQPPAPLPEPWREKNGQLVLQIDAPRETQTRRRPRAPMGRPSKLGGAEVAEVYGLYQDGYSLHAIAADRWEEWGYSGEESAVQSLKQAFRRRGLPIRSRSEAQTLRFDRERRAA